MRIVLIYNGSENLGIESISSTLKSKGHEVFLLFDPAVFSGDVFINIKLLSKLKNINQVIIKKALELKPDLIGFSVYTGNYRWSAEIAKGIKELSDVPIVFGGCHASAVADKILDNSFIDFVIVGEGEHAIIDLLENLPQGKSKEKLRSIPNLCFKENNKLHMSPPRPYIKDLDTLPYPDKRLFFDQEPVLESNPYLIMTSRGCPYNCTYCSNNMYRALYNFESQHVRRRSPENVINELKIAKKSGKVKQIYFIDDVFTVNKLWLEDFIERYINEINLPFFCYAYPSTINRDIASLLKKGGCTLLGMGIQSGSERIRRDIFHRRNTNDMIIKAMSILKDFDLNVSMDHIFGAPSETEQDLEQSYNLYRQLKPNLILTFWLNYYPRTQIIEKAKSLGLITDKEINEIEDGVIGYTHHFGSVKTDRDLFTCYEFLFELCTLIHNDAVNTFFSKIVRVVPFKKQLSNIIYTFRALRYHKLSMINKFRFLFSKHKKNMLYSP